MIRVHVICEGQTEEMFINELLQPALLDKGVWLVPALVGKPGHKGGNLKFERLQADIKNRLLGEPTAYCTTFFDYYGLPSSFPGKSPQHSTADITTKSSLLKKAMMDKLTYLIGEGAVRRFIPFVQMYEFEALLFSDPIAFAKSLNKKHLAQELSKILRQFNSPEHINDNPMSAPSKRIEALVTGYEKPLMGTLAALEIGLGEMRAKCQLFNSWVTTLENL